MHSSHRPPPSLFLQEDMEQAWCGSFGGGRVYLFTRRCPGKPTPNEDAAALLSCGPGCGVLAVADGMGGCPAGDAASGLTLRALARTVARAGCNGSAATDVRDAILDGMEAANREVTAMGIGAGTTVSAVELRPGKLRPYHVGDSLILLVDELGRRKLETVPHSPTGYLVEAGLLDAAEALRHRERHIVSNVIGTDDMRIEVGAALELAPTDTLLIASDGVTDNLTTDEVIEHLVRDSLEEAGAALTEACRSRMEDPRPGSPSKPDDLTLLLFRPGQGS